MNSQKCPDSKSCLITSLAILLDIPVQVLIDEIGHSILHISEVIYLAEKYGYALLYYDFNLLTEKGSGTLVYAYSKDKGILLYDDHAVAYDCGEICNPGAAQNGEPTGFVKLISLQDYVWIVFFNGSMVDVVKNYTMLLYIFHGVSIHKETIDRIDFLNGYYAKRMRVK